MASERASISSDIRINLEDAETQEIYSIFITAEQAERLKTDRAYANEMLKMIKCDKESSSSTIVIESAESDEKTTHEEGGAYKWPHEAILLLIEEYRLRQNDFTSGKISQKKIWLLIAEEMLKHGYLVTGPQCLSKFSGLKRTYKTIKDHNKKSGNGTRTWHYLSLMDDLLGTKPFMSPVSTVSTTGKRSQTESEQSDCSQTSNEDKENSTPKRKGQISSILQMMEDLRNDRRAAEAALERRHNENKEQRGVLIQAFKEMIDILKEKR